MTQTYWPFDTGAGAAVLEAQWTKMAKWWRASGVLPGELNELAASVTGSDRQVRISSGRAWIQGHFYENDTTEVMASLAVGDATNPRIDRVVVRLDWANNTVALVVLQGTPAASPSAPPLTQSSTLWEIPLVRIAVAAGATTINGANLTDERTWSRWVAWSRGASVASAADIALPSAGDVIPITGTTNIVSIVATGQAGRVVILEFAGALTVLNGSNLSLERDCTTQAGTILMLECDGTTWREIARARDTIAANRLLAGPASGSAGTRVARLGVNADLGADVARANLLVNPGMNHWQRGTSGFTADGAYTADRWAISLGASSTITVAREANVEIGGQFVLLATYTHSANSLIQQKLEGYRELRGRAISFSVKVRTALASAVRALIYTTGGSVPIDVRSSYHTGDNTWQTLTVTATPNTDATALFVGITLEAGTSLAIRMGNAVLVAGSVAADYVPLPPHEDFMRCLRYYEIWQPLVGGTALSVYMSAGNEYMTTLPIVPKAVVPTVTKAGTWTIAGAASQPVFDAPTTKTLRMRLLKDGSTGLMSTLPDSTDDLVTLEANP